MVMSGRLANVISGGNAVEVIGLVKSFGRVRAVDGLDLCVRTGEVHGFLGPNGSGKTTTLRVLLGLLRPDAGTVRLLGRRMIGDAVSLRRRIAYMPGDVALWPTLTGGEILDMLGGLRGGLHPQRRAALLERFELDPTRRARTYSRGNRQKVALVAALASDAELIVLDEPTAGLDPLMEAEFRAVLAEERAAGRTVLLSSHELAEVEAVCDRMTIIRQGRTVDSGTLAQLRHLARTEVVAELAGSPPDLATLPGVHDVQIEGRTVRASVDPQALDTVFRALSEVGLTALSSRPPSLEQVFLQRYASEGALR